MALQMNVELESGLAVNGAYLSIDSVSGSKSTLSLALNVHLSQATKAEGKSYLQRRHYQFAPSVADGAPNFIKQGYEHLKTLPEYAEAIDA